MPKCNPASGQWFHWVLSSSGEHPEKTVIESMIDGGNSCKNLRCWEMAYFKKKHINAAGFLPWIVPQTYMGWWLLGFPGPIWASLLYQNLGQDLYLGWSGWKSDHIGHVNIENFSIFKKTDTNQLSNIYELNGFKPFFWCRVSLTYPNLTSYPLVN